MQQKDSSRFLVRSTLSLAVSTALLSIANSAYAQTAPAATEKLDSVVITGSRIRSANITATSPVSQITAEEIALQRAVTVEDFSAKLPQLAGGVNSTSVGSDAYGAQTLDLRNLGQNRTLVLINGSRAVPFSFRNAVDVNFIPATLLKRVDVLTGGAAAVYGADAISGVVNFIINDGFRGTQVGANFRTAAGGGGQAGVNVTSGWQFGDKGSIVGYFEYTDRKELLAGKRDWAVANSVGIAGNGGNFTDVASGNKFSFDQAGQLTTTPQTTNYAGQFYLAQPLKRINASLFGKYDITDSVQVYGRIMYSGIESSGAPGTGQNPVVLNAPYGISSTNPFLTADIRSRLTFVNGIAQVNINRSLGELGVVTADNDRKTAQFQLGFKGSITPAIGWDVYAQHGSSKESITINGDGARLSLPGLINSVNFFGPGANLAGLAQPFQFGDRGRIQNVVAATVSGDSSDFFKLPAGPLGFAVGVESRRERGGFAYNPDLALSFKQSIVSGPPIPPFFKADEVYAEVSVPLLDNIPGIKNLTLDGAYRSSAYKKSVGSSNTYGTDKVGLSWTVVDDVRFRATTQSVIREPNFGEFANPVGSIPFVNLVNVARLRPRYAGDPCALGTGNAAQCARFGAPAVGSYDSLNPANLTGNYFFGGNPDIRAETGKTKTFGIVLTPKALAGFSMAVDYSSIDIRDAVGVVQPVDALTSCYITDPTANNPLCQAVSRDPVTGRIKDGFPIDRNLALIRQRGFDIDMSYRHDLPASMSGGKLTWGYQANIVKTYTIQRNPVLAEIDCKGTYGSRCSSDSVSLVAPDYRHRASLTYNVGAYTAGLGWKRIGRVKDSAVGSTETISAQNYFDLNFSVQPSIVKGLTVNFGIDNIGAKAPPRPANAALFNTYPDTYNVIGRSYGLTFTYKL